MKSKFAYVAIFLVLYSVFVVALAPASWLIAQVNLPSNVKVSAVEGTIWDLSLIHI